jgi:muramoyltetrapeptide carboxypeptidase LdcA involved in peptidoglycan recycling
MKIPKFLHKNDTISLCAPSFGILISPYKERYESALKLFTDKGYKLIETKSTRLFDHAQSAPAKIRAQEFMECYLDDNIDFIISVAGGERMMEILPYLDFNLIRQAKPKFFMGFSDNTVLTFALTTLCDIATIYGVCMPSFGMRPWDDSISDAYEVITGTKTIQHSYPFYEAEGKEQVVGQELSGYNLTAPVKWETNTNQDITVSGILLGGCLDVLSILVGTKFDQVKEFALKQDEGILWYLEACDLHSLATLRALWQMKYADWFVNVKGFIIGRPLNTDVIFDVSQKDAVLSVLEDLGVPIIFDADIGHVPPMMTMINGVYATVSVVDEKGTIEMFIEKG